MVVNPSILPAFISVIRSPPTSLVNQPTKVCPALNSGFKRTVSP